MSKKINLRAVTFVLALASVATSAAPHLKAQQPQQSGQTNAAASRNAAVIAATDEVLRETSQLRELKVLRPVKSGAQSRAEIERMIMRNLDEESSPAEMRASELALKKLGLVPADFRYRSFIINLLTEQVAGYYDPKQGQFYLADWIDLEGQKPVIAHELTHALQDQHFNLRRFERWPKGDGDRELAIHALIEGDAMMAMYAYVRRNPMSAIALAWAMNADVANSQQLDRAPRALRESLMFPYERGLAFAEQLFRRGGWARVSQAFADLPQSTEQILHVEKYFAREMPVKIEMPDLSPRLGRNWKRTDADANGEWGLYLILDEYLKNDEPSAQRAAAGWGGDRYALYEGAREGEVVIAQLTAWDTAADAREFFDAYARRTERRYAGATEIENMLGDGDFNVIAWRTTSEGAVRVERRGTRVAILEGVPEGVNAKRLAASVLR